jgi:hypothetical protein
VRLLSSKKRRFATFNACTESDQLSPSDRRPDSGQIHVGRNTLTLFFHACRKLTIQLSKEKADQVSSFDHDL